MLNKNMVKNYVEHLDELYGINMFHVNIHNHNNNKKFH